MTNLERRFADIQVQASQSGPENQEALVRSIVEVARQVARLVSIRQFECGLDADDPDPSEGKAIYPSPIDNERVIEALNQVERNAGAIYVRECIDGEWRNVSLIELPTHLAIKHTCRIVRKVLFLNQVAGNA